jgi:exodeoxyribonuclease VII small subunit
MSDSLNNPTSLPEGAGGGSLESRLDRLDQIVRALEGGELPLEEGLALFEEGVGHLKEADQILRAAELRVDELVADSTGRLDVRPFEDGEGR